MLYNIEVKRRGTFDRDRGIWNFVPDETADWDCSPDNVFHNRQAAEQVAEMIRRDGFSVRIVEVPDEH